MSFYLVPPFNSIFPSQTLILHRHFGYSKSLPLVLRWCRETAPANVECAHMGLQHSNNSQDPPCPGNSSAKNRLPLPKKEAIPCCLMAFLPLPQLLHLTRSFPPRTPFVGRIPLPAPIPLPSSARPTFSHLTAFPPFLPFLSLSQV